MRHLVLLALGLALVACDPPAVAPDAASSASSAPPPPAPSAAEPAPPPPNDLDVAALQKALKCGGAGAGACAVLAKIASCKGWEPVVPSGDGRWLGRGHVVEGAKTTDQFTLLRSRRVPTAEIGPGQLPVRISVTELPKAEGAAFDQADKTIRTFERQDAPARNNPTLEYVKKRSDWPEASAMRTAGGQVYVIEKEGTYVCQGAKKQLYVVQRASSKASSGDGLYAELWPTSW